MAVICSECDIFNLVNNPEMSLLCMCCLTMFLHYCIIDSLTVKEHNAIQGVAGGTSTSSLRVHVCFFVFLLVIPKWEQSRCWRFGEKENGDKDSRNNSTVCCACFVKRLQNARGMWSRLSRSSYCTCPHTTWPTSLECHSAHLCNVWRLRHY